MTMSRLGLRTQLLGLTLVLLGAFRDLQTAVQGYVPDESPSFGSLLVVAGVIVVALGLIGPTLTGGGA